MKKLIKNDWVDYGVPPDQERETTYLDLSRGTIDAGRLLVKLRHSKEGMIFTDVNPKLTIMICPTGHAELEDKNTYCSRCTTTFGGRIESGFLHKVKFRNFMLVAEWKVDYRRREKIRLKALIEDREIMVTGWTSENEHVVNITDLLVAQNNSRGKGVLTDMPRHKSRRLCKNGHTVKYLWKKFCLECQEPTEFLIKGGVLTHTGVPRTGRRRK